MAQTSKFWSQEMAMFNKNAFGVVANWKLIRKVLSSDNQAVDQSHLSFDKMSFPDLTTLKIGPPIASKKGGGQAVFH